MLPCVRVRGCVYPHVFWHVTLERDCRVLLGAAGVLSTGDLFPLIGPCTVAGVSEMPSARAIVLIVTRGR